MGPVSDPWHETGGELHGRLSEEMASVAMSADAPTSPRSARLCSEHLGCRPPTIGKPAPGAATAGCEEGTGVVSVRVRCMSGVALFGPRHLPASTTLGELFACSSPFLHPEDRRATVLLGTRHLCDFEARLADLLCDGLTGTQDDAKALEFLVLWEPPLQKGEQVVVARDFPSRTNYRSSVLLKGQVGKILKIHSDPGDWRTTMEGCRADGDALVSFAGGSHWVPKHNLRNLLRL
mmetsp:Transcript_13861/g.39538  ORF Transcript_13861/g.39538 Transcript_13861/m.39538 type:complete len:235 (+) Transcript_13861:75-779(+)